MGECSHLIMVDAARRARGCQGCSRRGSFVLATYGARSILHPGRRISIMPLPEGAGQLICQGLARQESALQSVALMCTSASMPRHELQLTRTLHLLVGQDGARDIIGSIGLRLLVVVG
jgi:hypothetical protein